MGDKKKLSEVLPRRVFLFFVSHKDKLVAAFVAFAFFNFKAFYRPDQGSQFRETIVPGVKVGLFLLKQVAHVSEKCPALIIAQIFYGRCNQF